MYERFTDRARKSCQLANQEAQRCCHDFIAPEHLLVALVKEGIGIAARILNAREVSIPVARRVLEETYPQSNSDIIMGKLPHNPAAKRVIENSIHEARDLNDNYVGTEHMLLGIIKLGEGAAFSLLQKSGVTREGVIADRGEMVKSKAKDVLPTTVFAWAIPKINAFQLPLTLDSLSEAFGVPVMYNPDTNSIEEKSDNPEIR